ncbi:hypothetical protein SLS62_001250 [Diatrype stigma]|uniref:Rhodopsin domain-containing protein n=1 Tax=Diatrype stigma TaxID=117547 RepID=A0AAN9V2B4_9PEZI
MSLDLSAFYGDPPPGEDRWAAGTNSSRQQTIGAATLTVATLVYALRVFSRLSIAQVKLRTDDWLAGAAMISCWCFYGCTMGMIKFGGCGRNIWQVTYGEYQVLLKWTVSVNIFYMLSSDLAKLSLLFLYLRITPDNRFHIVVKTLAAAFALYALVYAMISIFSCRPISASWDLALMAAGSTCINKANFFLAASVANIVMDVIILVMPVPIIIPLQIPRRQKASLLLLFATGGFVIVVAIYNSVLTVNLFLSNNYTWGLSYELSWMYAELSACVICASASSLKPVFVRCIPGLFSSHFGYSGESSGAGDGTGGSRKDRRQRSQSKKSRKHGDAIELESGDERSESGRKGCCDEDEVKLWSRPNFFKRGDDSALTKVQVSVSKGDSNFSGSHVDTNHLDWRSGSTPPVDSPLSRTNLEINVVRSAEVTYSPIERHPSVAF